jgi:hypothetical protein
MRRTSAGAGIEHQGRVLVPVARSFLLRPRGGRGGLVWNRPVAVLVEDPSGKRRLSIADPTRRIQWTLLAAGLAVAWFVRHRRRRANRRPFGR